MKIKTTYVCQNCGTQSSKWVGKCNVCGEWNSYVEEIVEKSNNKVKISSNGSLSKPIRIDEIGGEQQERIDTKDNELNRVLGGGMVQGSLILIGGEPGIGKSTLVLQLALGMNNNSLLYVSGEESVQQIKLRATRLSNKKSECLLVSETSLEKIILYLEEINPDIVVIDSIQTVATDTIESATGSVSQIRECTSSLLRYAKEKSLVVILIGHITKDGHIAGPKILEHMVDTVLQFEGDQNYMYRILRSVKNRFGSTSEIGIYEMRNNGLRQVENPSELLLSENENKLSGGAIAATIEGIRPILIEVQALVSSAVYGTPQRSATGFDLRRLNMLLAVLEKRAGFKLAVKDVFLNIAGGIKVNDPAIDLAVVMSVLSSNMDVEIPRNVCFAGEVGLSGEIRSVGRVEQRIAEAEKLGFFAIYIPKNNVKGMNLSSFKIKIYQVSKVSEVFKNLLA